MSKIDRRITRTKNSLLTTYLYLLKHKDFSDITVKELCDKSDVDKATFYKHYQDKYNFTESLVNQEISNYHQLLIRRFTNNDVSYESLRTIMDHLQIFRQIDSNDFRVDCKLRKDTFKVYSKFFFPALGSQLKDYDLSMHVFSAMMIEFISLYENGNFSPSQYQIKRQFDDLSKIFDYVLSR